MEGHGDCGFVIAVSTCPSLKGPRQHRGGRVGASVPWGVDTDDRFIPKTTKKYSDVLKHLHGAVGPEPPVLGLGGLSCTRSPPRVSDSPERALAQRGEKEPQRRLAVKSTATQ